MTAEQMAHQCVFRCDGCGCACPGYVTRTGTWCKPESWFQRTDSDGTQLACSRRCIELVASRSGKTSVVLPI